MRQKAKLILPITILLAVFLSPFVISQNSSATVSVANNNIKTLEQLLEKRVKYFTPTSSYVPDRIVNILIVPGHDDEYSGAVFGGIKEVEFNREIAQRLFTYLSQEPGINPILAHEKNEYNASLLYAFANYREEIEYFIEKSISNFESKIEKQEIELEDSGFHNAAVPEARYRLYGINWWANQRDIDLIIHIHFNDYADRKSKKVGEYSGFAIYTPGENFENHELSKVLGESIFDELVKIRPISNLPFESEGIIEGHELIAVGANESLKAGSVLIEYGYIYEDSFQDKNKRDVTFDYLAYMTYLGIKNVFNENSFTKSEIEIKTTPNKTTRDNLIWQFEKAREGLYPPEGKTLRDCPIAGYFGECSRLVK